MPESKNLAQEEKIHLAFEISLLLKALFALGQIIGGIVALFVTKDFLLKTVSVLTQEELAEDPRDLIANYLLHSAQNLSIGTQLFVALYLLRSWQHQAMANHRTPASETLVLPHGHPRLWPLHRLSAVPLQLHAFCVAPADHARRCHRHRAYVA